MPAVSAENPLKSILPSASHPGHDGQGIDRMLHAIRCHLGMDVAFVSEFRGPVRVFNHVDADGRSPIQVGDMIPMEDGYCQRVVDGRLPELMPDTAAVPAAMALPDTRAIPIGSHLSVPIRLRDGRVFGTFCCFGFSSNTSLNERDLNMMRAFAELASYQIEDDVNRDQLRRESEERVRFAIEHDDPSIVYQPIYRLDDGTVSGLESLSRFRALPQRSPDKWFNEAACVDMGVELELCAIRKALTPLPQLPPHVYVGINCSPATVLSGELASVLEDSSPERVVIEITEHAQVDDYERLIDALAPLRVLGARVSIDDAGAGYASMRHILALQPDIIKLDISLTRDVDKDPKRYALAAALIEFARQTNSYIVAEGVETAAELEALRALGAQTAQGYFLAKPQPLDRVSALLCA